MWLLGIKLQYVVLPFSELGDEMRCLYCEHDETKVLDKRDNEEYTRRRRECLKCRKRFTTYEKAEINLIVVKKDGSKESFSREKLLSGMIKACKNRPVDEQAIEKAVDDIEARLVSMGPEMTTKKIGELVMKKLLKLDKVAYIRFTSVYRSFDDIVAFEKEIKAIKR